MLREFNINGPALKTAHNIRHWIGLQMKIEEKLLQLCQKKQLTLGAAESCTGGAFSARLTAIPDASKCFMGSIVAYTNTVKTKLLNIPQEKIEKYGAVSLPVVTSMLEAVCMQLNSALGVAITGFAGPTGGTSEAPIGTVFIAVGGKGLPTKTIHLHLKGSRQEIIQQTVEYAILALVEILEP